MPRTVYIDATSGCGPITNGYSRFSHALLPRLGRAESLDYTLRYISALAPTPPELPGNWTVAPKDAWRDIVSADDSAIYHDITTACEGDTIFALPKRVPRMVTMHDTIFLSYYLRKEDPDEASRVQSMFRQLLEESLIIPTVSHCAKTDILAEFPSIDPEKVLVIYPGVDPVFAPVDRAWAREYCWYFGIDPQKPIVLHCGGYHEHKNVGVLITAFAKVRERFPEAQLVLTGSLPPQHGAYWYAKLRHLGLFEAVSFTGRVSDEDLVAMYTAADVFVYPSLIEGFGFPPVEAEYCGTPVIASDIPIFHETLSEQADFVDPFDVAAWAETITRHLHGWNPTSPRSPKKRRDYDWDNTARGYRDMYASLS